MENSVGKDSYEKTKEEAKKLYSKIGHIWCPALNDYVVFNSIGFQHLTWQGKTIRRRKEQLRRFALLPRTIEIVGEPVHNVEYRRMSKDVIVKRHGKKFAVKTRAQFWGLNAEMDGKKIRVVIGKIGDGGKHFFSVFETKTSS